MKKPPTDLNLPPGKLPPNASKAEVAEMQRRGHETIARGVDTMPRAWKEPVVLLDAPFKPNVELMRAAFKSAEEMAAKTAPEIKMKKVFAQDWEESERGWGVRPDGTTLHATLAKMNEYKKKFYSDQPSRGADGSPDEYTRERGDPYEIEVDETLYKQVVAAGFALHALCVKRGKDANGFTTWAVHLPPPVPVQPASREELVALLKKIANAEIRAEILADIQKILLKEYPDDHRTIINGKIFDTKSGKLVGEVGKE